MISILIICPTQASRFAESESRNWHFRNCFDLSSAALNKAFVSIYVDRNHTNRGNFPLVFFHHAFEESPQSADARHVELQIVLADDESSAPAVSQHVVAHCEAVRALN